MARISEARLYVKLETEGHKHFCSNRDCRVVYDCLEVPYKHRCAQPRKNELCHGCHGSPVPVWSAGQQVQPCCVNNVRQVVDRDEIYAHRLGGTGPWFKCKTCARCTGWPQGFNPHEQVPSEQHQEKEYGNG